MIKTFMIITTVMLSLFIGGGLLLSNDYEIRRSMAINAPIKKVHAIVEDLSQWQKWSPWAESIKGMQTKITKAKGLGATQSWKTDNGDSSLTITKCDPDKGIDYSVYFDNKRYENRAGFIYEAKNDQMILTWYMKGNVPTPVLGGYVAFLTEMTSDDLFDQGLSNIKKLAEKE